MGNGNKKGSDNGVFDSEKVKKNVPPEASPCCKRWSRMLWIILLKARVGCPRVHCVRNIVIRLSSTFICIINLTRDLWWSMMIIDSQWVLQGRAFFFVFFLLCLLVYSTSQMNYSGLFKCTLASKGLLLSQTHNAEWDEWRHWSASDLKTCCSHITFFITFLAIFFFFIVFF